MQPLKVEMMLHYKVSGNTNYSILIVTQEIKHTDQ